jgi:hypothetical protein
MYALRVYRHRLAALLAAMFLFVSSGSLAHDIEHVFDAHQDASCALHLFAGHQTGFPAGPPAPPAVPAGREAQPGLAAPVPTSSPSRSYLARAPPGAPFAR